MMDKQWRPRSSLAIFITSLHLLDLDTLPDWPLITISTFQSTPNSKSTSQNLQARIKATEWALYQLFQLYSPETTRQALSPNFPPKTPGQSLNLRTGLFKSLSELKKNGQLPRECILRKTMLDECKGDKFEDLLAAFSTLVLRKTLADSRTKVLSVCTSAKPEHVVPLVIAHHVSLQRKLQKREKLNSDARIFAKSLDNRRTDLAARLRAVSQPEECNDEAISQIDDHAFREKLVHAFARHPQWVRYLFEGNVDQTSASRAPNDHTVLEWPFEHSADEMSATDRVPLTFQANQPISHLRGLISQHQVRIRHLETLQISLSGNDTTAPIVTRAKEPKADHMPRSPEKAVSEQRFTRHKMLSLTGIPG